MGEFERSIGGRHRDAARAEQMRIDDAADRVRKLRESGGESRAARPDLPPDPFLDGDETSSEASLVRGEGSVEGAPGVLRCKTEPVGASYCAHGWHHRRTYHQHAGEWGWSVFERCPVAAQRALQRNVESATQARSRIRRTEDE